MVLDDLVDLEEKKEHRGIPPGANIFEWRHGTSRNLSKKKALEENLFTNDIILRLLNSDKYRKGKPTPRHQLQTRKQIIKMGVDSSNIKKIKDKGVIRFYLTVQAVMVVLKHFYNGDYKEEEVLEDLKSLVY